jgi:hypothetical protein
MSVPRTFRELMFGAWFISFPEDGDDHGHGGYQGAHNIFIELAEVTLDQYGVKRNAVRLLDGNFSFMSDQMKVLEVSAK